MAALDFEKDSSQSASITDASQSGLDITGTLSIECWVKVESDPGAGVYYGIMWKGGINTANSDTATQYGLWYDNDGAYRLNFGVRGTGNWKDCTYNVQLTPGTWYHVAGVYNPSTSIKLYLDGTEVASNPNSIPASLVNTAQPFIVGAMYSGSAGNYFDGLIDEVRVWNDIRTQTELNNNKLVQLTPGSEANLVSLWECDEGSGTTVEDKKGNNDLTTNSGWGTGIVYILAYTLTAELGTFALTGVASSLQKGYNMIAALGTFTLTGVSSALSKGYQVIAETGSFIVSGIASLFPTTGWVWRNKPTFSWSNRTKPSDDWTDRTKPTPNWTT